MKEDQVAHVFVGADRSQLLAVKVLEHSIKRHTDMEVVVRPMHDLILPEPKDIRQGKRTGFSFARFAIPQLMGYRGKAIYLDADMLVVRDFRELYSIPFDGAKVVIQKEVSDEVGTAGRPKKRIKQCSVMLLDCSALDWDPIRIIAGLDGGYTYEDLLYHLCILTESEIGYEVPFEWNSLEHYEPGKTGLIHYTDMESQPWVAPENPNGYLWLEEIRLMLRNGSLTWEELENEVRLGYFRPSLLLELKEGDSSRPLAPERIKRYQAHDAAAKFEKHKAARDAENMRRAAIRKYEIEAGLAGGLGQIAIDRLKSMARPIKRRLFG